MAVINSITVGEDTFTISGWGEPGGVGYTPVGTIIAMMANTAPTHYLACNGAVYNIIDYVELSDFFEDQFGSKNYFGGDGETTFAVPDLRGEFLRGAGTNSHTNQGSGANVGVHQNSTEINPGWFNNSSGGFSFSESASATYVSLAKNADYSHNYGTRQSYAADTDLKRVTSTSANAYMSCIRPTNTSVLFCIATKNLYIENPAFNYSTDEKVIGGWIDGKPLYQKTIEVTTPSTQTSGVEETNSYDIADNISICWVAECTNHGNIQSNLTVVSSKNKLNAIRTYYSPTYKKLCVGNTLPDWNNLKYYVTVRYTKTTDV